MKLYEFIILAVAWALWLTPFVLTGWHGSRTTARDRRGRWGIALQAISYAVLWQGHFWLYPPAMWRVAFSVILQLLAVLLSWTGASALGRHLRFDAALRSDHKLVKTGPYRMIRHPIYASMFFLLLGDGLMVANPQLLAIAVVVFVAGTEIRVRTEDRLLSERFGQEFKAYKRRVRAYIPLVR
jgi:protein-S-isoprenylcysteine O-methyltransferase Ste14